MSDMPNVTNGILELDLTDTPNEIPNVEAGIYDFKVVSANVENSKDGSQLNAVINLQVMTEGSQKGRRLRDTIFGLTKDQSSPSNIKLRKFVLSALGEIPKGGLNLPGTADKIVRAEVFMRPDKQNPTLLYSNVKNYIVPPEVLARNTK
jgi:hypothetical protein